MWVNKSNNKYWYRVSIGIIIGLSSGIFASQAYALTGVGAKVDQNVTGTLVSINGKHAPNSEVIVISNQEVVAGVLENHGGSFTFNFRVTNSQLNYLEVFAVDPAGYTNRIRVPSGGLNNELLPPTLVLDPKSKLDENTAHLGGYSYPGALVTVVLTGDNNYSRVDDVLVDSDGAWDSTYVKLTKGTYIAVATSSLGNIKSQKSQDLTLIVTDANVGEQVSNVVEQVVKNVIPDNISQTVNQVVPQAETVTRTVTPVATAGLLAQLSMFMRDILYWLLQGAISLMQLLGFWKKRHPWGIVYDAVTKHPIALATVRLYTLAQGERLIETDVTSKAGVFSFYPEPGDYLIRIAKPGYLFPSLLIRSYTDGEYERVYHGEKITFRDKKTPVDVSIPIDPSAAKLDWKFKIRSFVRSWTYPVTIASLAIGLLMSFISVVGGKGGFNGILMLFYGLVLGLQIYTGYRRKNSWGVVTGPDGNPVKGVQLDLIDPRFEKLVQRRVTDEDGKYQFIVPEGKYVIRVGSVEYNLVTYSDKLYRGQDIIVNGEKPKLIAFKLQVIPAGPKP